MARVCPAPERTLLGGQELGQHLKTEVTNADGTWIDISSYVESVSIDESVDLATASAVITLIAVDGSDSLHPLMTGSPLNVDDLDVYAPLIFGGHGVKVSTGASDPEASVPSTPWRLVFSGLIDEPASGNNGDTLAVQARDLGVVLLDRYPEVEREYGSEDGLPVEEVMQQILDDNGISATIVLPDGSPLWFVETFIYDGTISIGEELRLLAQQIGWDIKYRWAEDNPDVNALELQFYDPDRTKTVADFTLPPSEYLTVEELKFGDRNVRNVIGIWFQDSAAGGAWAYRSVEDAASIAIYGRRYMEIAEAYSSNINTETEALKMINGALSDLSTPFVDHALTSRDLWFAQVGDLVALPANAVHYDEDQKFAIVSLHREWSGGQGLLSIRTRGKPGGAYSEWIRKQGKGLGPTTGVPAPRFTYLLGEQSHGGGVTGDGMVWVGVEFEANTEYVTIWGKEGEDSNTPTPDISTNNMCIPRLYRPEGDFGDNWKTVVGIATRPERWRKVRACGFGRDGAKGPDWIPPAVQALDPTPTPDDGVIQLFSIVTSAAADNVITVKPGVIDPDGGNWIFLRRDGVDIIQEFIDADTTTRFLYDRKINPNAAYTYEAFIWNEGVSGKHRRHGAGIPTIPGFDWDQQAPKLIYDISSSKYAVALYWSLTGFPTADHIVFEVGKNGVNFGSELGQTSTASTVFLDFNTKAKWYRMRLENASNVILGYSPPAYFPGSGIPPSWGGTAPPEWNPVPTASFIRTGGGIGVSTLVMGFICPTSGAVECAIERSDDGLTGWVEEFRSGQLAGDQWNAGPGVGDGYYRLNAKDASDASLALSTVEHWPGFV